jgi:hypothetical protein
MLASRDEKIIFKPGFKFLRPILKLVLELPKPDLN